MSPFAIVSRTLSVCTLSVIHAILWSRTAIALVYNWLALGLLAPFKHKGSKTDLILKDSKTLKKIPLHLALVINEESVSHSDLSLLVCWAFSFGIQWVSIYDMKGEVKRGIDDLKDVVKKQYSMYEGLKSQRLRIGVLKEFSSLDIGTGNSLVVLSGSDGYAALTNLTTKLCTDTVHGVIHSRDIDSSQINSSLLGVISEPNLALVFGSSHSLTGYIPWWTRVVEILWLPSHHKITYPQFLCELKQYGNTQQRFGK